MRIKNWRTAGEQTKEEDVCSECDAPTIWDLLDLNLVPRGLMQKDPAGNVNSKRSHVNGCHLSTGESTVRDRPKQRHPHYPVLIGFAKQDLRT